MKKSYMKHVNLDTAFGLLVAGLVEAQGLFKNRPLLGRHPRVERWKPGEKLRLLLVGYNGARNTGADARVAALVNQLYALLGRDNVHLGVLTLDPEQTRDYFPPPTESIPLNRIYLRDITAACASYHAAILCEGSCFTSTFANALTYLFVATAGLMKKFGKPCIAYGVEAGRMDPFTERLVRRYCADVYFISRSRQSSEIVRALGLHGEIGTDTAWTFQGSPRGWAEEILRRAGWDGKKPIAGFAVIDPFCWPVKPDLLRLLKLKLKRAGVSEEDRYGAWYFFSRSPERALALERYTSAMARAIRELAEHHRVFPVLIGMEALDLEACRKVNALLPSALPILGSQEYDAHDLTSVLRRLSVLVTSRYHARVLSMPEGVPSMAVSMDERLGNLLEETDHLDKYHLSTTDAELDQKLPAMLEALWCNRDAVRAELRTRFASYLSRMDLMGALLKVFLHRHFPQLPSLRALPVPQINAA